MGVDQCGIGKTISLYYVEAPDPFAARRRKKIHSAATVMIRKSTTPVAGNR
jgi:hypothetical protein